MIYVLLYNMKGGDCSGHSVSISAPPCIEIIRDYSCIIHHLADMEIVTCTTDTPAQQKGLK